MALESKPLLWAMIAIRILALSCLLAPSIVQSQELPEFDGVYFRLSDGSFAEIPRVDFDLAKYSSGSTLDSGRIEVQIGSFYIHGIAGDRPPSLPGFFRSDFGDNFSIIVQGRNITLSRVHDLVDVGLFQNFLLSQPRRRYFESEGEKFGGPNLTVYDNQWGYGDINWRSKAIGPFTTEYVLSSDMIHGLFNRSRLSPSPRNSDLIFPVFGHVIILSDGTRYPFALMK